MPSDELRVVFDLTDGDYKPRFVNGQELPDWENGPSLADYISQKTDEGCCLKTSVGPQTYIFECPCTL